MKILATWWTDGVPVTTRGITIEERDWYVDRLTAEGFVLREPVPGAKVLRDDAAGGTREVEFIEEV